MEHLFGSISTQLVSSVVLTLIHFIWQAAAVALVLKLSLTIVPHKYLLTRYRLAVIALAATVVMPCFTLYYLVQSPDFVQSSIEYSSRAIGLYEQLPEQQSIGVLSGIAESSEQVNGVSTLSNSVEGQNNLMLSLLIAWVIGCLLMLTKFVFDLNSTYRLAKDGVAPVNQKIDEIVCGLAQKYKLSRPIQILKSSVVNVPVVVGWLRPVILLPIAVSVGLDKAQLELIIAHELAHIKRMDFAVNIIQSLVQIVFFYHPSVHWINQIIRDEREYICDSMALNIIGNNPNAKLNLAKALLNTEELREGNFSLIAVAASGGKLKNRISHILENEYRPATSIKTLLLSVFAFMFSLAAIASTIAIDNSSNSLQLENRSLEQITMNGLVDLKLADKFVKEEAIKQADILIKGKGQQHPESELAVDKAVNINNESDQVSLIKLSDIKPGPESKSAPKNSHQVSLDVPIKRSKDTVVSSETRPLHIAKIDDQVLTNKGSQVETLKSLQLPENNIAEEQLEKSLVKSSNAQKQLNGEEMYKTASLDLGSSTNYTEPRALYTPYPRYPKQSWRTMLNQTVPVDFVINSDGKIGDIKIKGRVDRAFAREVKRKLRKWRYEPALENGKKVAFMASLEFEFKAPQEEKIILISTGTRIRR